MIQPKEPLSRQRLGRPFALLLITLGLAASTHALACISEFTVTPIAPSCEQQVTIAVEGYFPDLCWSVTDIEFVVDGSEMGFIIHAVDAWEPGTVCAEALYEYSATETVGPLPTGSYSAYAWEQVQSLRDPEEDFVWTAFLACCEEPPNPVNDLRLEKIHGGGGVRFTWTDVAGGEAYDLYQDPSAHGLFSIHVGTATTGVTGIDAPAIGPSLYYLLSTTNDCGEGPKH